jgi:hypothetical protein
MGGKGVGVTVVLPPSLAHPTGQPRVGDVYWVETSIYGGDKRERRPLVVVRAASPPLLDNVLVVTRTRDTTGPGVKHAKNLALQLNADGVFSLRNRKRVEQPVFFTMPRYASFMGEIEEEVLADVLAMVGL